MFTMYQPEHDLADEHRHSVTCILSEVLGNKTISLRLAASVDRALSATSEKIWFNAESYRRFPAPRPLRDISALESELVARRMFRDRELAGTVVINGFGLAQAVAAKCKRMVVAIDSTPRIVNAMVVPRTAVHRALRPLLARWQDMRFGRLARQVSAWLPLSESCKHSLVRDYGVSRSRCFVTRAPQPVIDPQAARTSLTPPFELLFVGNDFGRKGGPVLLEAMCRPELSRCRLTVVSNDPALSALTMDAVQVVSGITDPQEIAALYRRAHLLVLPTGYDMYPNVICEGLALGLPFVSTSVGSIGDLVSESGAGHTIPRFPTAEELAGAVAGTLSDEVEYRSRSQAAIRYAQQYLTQAAFDAAVGAALRCAG